MESGIQREDVCRFFAGYADSFANYDVSAISKMWELPAYICGQAYGKCFLDRKLFEENTAKRCALYRNYGMVQVEAKVLETNCLFEGVWAATVAYRLMNKFGRAIISWHHFYLLRAKEGVLRAFVAVADGEQSAWENLFNEKTATRAHRGR